MMPDMLQPALDNTGERLIPDAEAGSLNHQVHQSRYEYARRFLPAGGDVLDYGCGTGYGLHYLAGFTEGHCVGVDKEEGVRYATQRYPAANVEHVAADVTQPTARFGKFDLIVSFDVIEHVADIDAYLANIADQLRDETSVALISTPCSYRRQNFWPLHNPYHLCELTTAEFFSRLDPYFTIDEILLTLGMLARVRRKSGSPNNLPAMSITLSGAHVVALEDAIEELSRQVESLSAYPAAAQAVSRRLYRNRADRPTASRTYRVQERGYLVRPLTPTNPIQGRFVATTVNLSAIDIALALYQPLSGSELNFTLYQGEQTVAQVTEPSLLLREDQPQRFLFAPIPDAAGKEFCWRLAPADESFDSAVGAWCDIAGQPLFQEYYCRYRWEGAPKYSTVTNWITPQPRAWLTDWPELWTQHQLQAMNLIGRPHLSTIGAVPPVNQRPWAPDAPPWTKLRLAIRHFGLRATVTEAIHYFRWRFGGVKT